MNSPSKQARRLSVILIVVSSVGFSFNGLIVRLIDSANPMQAIFYRSLGMSIGLFTVYAAVYRGAMLRHISAVGKTGVMGSALMGASTICMVFAMYNATVANVVYVSSAIPFFTAALAWLILREKISFTTLVYMTIAFCGITVMVGGGITLGAGFGNLMALLCALMYSLFVVVIRGRQNINMTPMVALAGIWVCLCVPLLSGDLAVSRHDLILCVLWGAIIAAAGHSMFVMAARNLAGAEVTFLMLLEFVLAPAWVWLVVNEVPAWTTMLGGALVMGALVGWTVANNRQSANHGT